MYDRGMAKKKSESDVNVTAFEILNAVTGELPCHASPKPIKKKLPPAKNPAAVALGRLGGLKGGKARARKLSSKERKRIAAHAAKIRWGK
jgi:hypothetical protein